VPLAVAMLNVTPPGPAGWFKLTVNVALVMPLLPSVTVTSLIDSTGRETQVVVRFWIITMLLCLIGLSTLKLR